MGSGRRDRMRGRLLKDVVTCLIDTVKPDLIAISGDLAWAGYYEPYQ